MRHLVVNADDFGFTPDVNDGIVEAHRNGILTATTLMANGDAFDHAVSLGTRHPSLDIGCHLVLVGGRSSLDGKPLPDTVGGLIRGLALGRWNPYRELRAQIEKILAAGAQPTHLDTHKHTHLLPPVLDVVARLSKEFGIPWVRRPFDFPMTTGSVPSSRRIVTRARGLLRPKFHSVLGRYGCRTTDHFAGFQWTGTFTAADLAHLIERLPEGTTEFMCHPGFLREELQAAPTRLKTSREAELKALTDPSLRPVLARCGVVLASYRELPHR